MLYLLKESLSWLLLFGFCVAIYQGFLIVTTLHKQAMEVHRNFWNLVTRRNAYGAVHLCWVLAIGFFAAVILLQEPEYGGLAMFFAIWGYLKLREAREGEDDPFAKKGDGPSTGASG